MKRKRILEIGCGQGFNACQLSKKGEVTAIDISARDIEIARKRFPRVDFRVMDAVTLRFPDRYFDEVHAIDVLEHVADLDRVLAEVKRVLKPSGIFIANIPFHKSEQWLQSLRPGYFAEINHLRVFGEGELERLLERRRFKLLKKAPRDFLNHLFQYYMFTRSRSGRSQLGIGNWNDNWRTRTLFALLMLFDTRLFRTPLVFFPVWIFTLPPGIAINSVGNRFFPKSLQYTFKNEG